jgi:flagellar hook-basal body complex protein FliE
VNLTAISSGMSSHALRDIGPSQRSFDVNDVGEMNVPKDQSFAGLLDRSVSDVNKLLNTADKKQSEVAVGKSENLHDAMISFEKADVALKLLVQVRNKAIEAYHEVMRMQV